MKLHEILKVMPTDMDAGYITVRTEAGSIICLHVGPGFVYHKFKDREVVSVRPCISLGELGETARAEIIITVKE